MKRWSVGLLYVFLGGVLMTMITKKPIEAALTLSDVAVWAFGVLWFWASFVVGRAATRTGRSRVPWTAGAVALSPLVMWVLLLHLHWFSSEPRRIER